MIPSGYEIRMTAPAEVRRLASFRAGGGGLGKICGYAAMFDVPSEDLGGYTEVIRQGAFLRCLVGKPDVRGRYNHSQLLARTAAGTMTLAEDACGLWYGMSVPNTTVGRDLIEMIDRGDVNGSSFCFRVDGPTGEHWSWQNGVRVRELLRIQLIDVGPCDFPAYTATAGNLYSRFTLSGVGRATPNLNRARIRLAEAETTSI